MENIDIIKARHSVRSYESKKIEDEKREILDSLILDINKNNGLDIQIFYDEPMCFDSRMAHYGKFNGVENYIALVGAKSDDLDEKLGYYGEKLVLKAQELGLNTCWVAMTHGKSKARVEKCEKEVCIISLGYGKTDGIEHKSKSIEDVSNYKEGMPLWFLDGVKAALLAPTAKNQQKFYISLVDDEIKLDIKGMGFYTKLDLGIVKYHFELISGRKAN